MSLFPIAGQIRDALPAQARVFDFLWDKSVALAPTWQQAFSVDDGKTWATDWHMAFVRPGS